MERFPDRVPTPFVVLAALVAAAVLGVTVTACTGSSDPAAPSAATASPPDPGAPEGAGAPSVASPPTMSSPGPGLPYAHTGPGDVGGPAAQARRLVYVPNQVSGTVQVIDPATYQVVARYRVA